MEALLRPVGILHRTVKLSGAWYRDASGPMLSTLRDGGASVALLPRPFGGYAYFDYAKNKRVVLTAHTAAQLSGDALCFYKPLPQRALKARDICVYALSSLSSSFRRVHNKILILQSIRPVHGKYPFFISPALHTIKP
jgi:hypothetical protein